MYLTKRPNGRYYVVYIHEGKKRYVSTHTDQKRIAQQFLRIFKNEPLQKEKKRASIRLSCFFEEYTAFSQTHHTSNTTKTIESNYREFLRLEGDMPLNAISDRVVDHFLAIKSKDCSAHTIARYYRTLRSMFEQAKKWKYIDENPFASIPKPKAPAVELQFFSKDEFAGLLKAIPETSIIRKMVYFGIFTGCRLSEVLNAEWKYADLERRVYIVTCNERFQTKSKRNRVIPMNEFLWDMLSGLKDSDTFKNYIFHKPDGTLYHESYVSHKFKKYCRRAGLGHLSFHSLRKSFGCWLLMSDVPIFTISRLLGHSSVTVTTAHYATLYTDRLHDVVNKLTIGDLPAKEQPIEIPCEGSLCANR